MGFGPIRTITALRTLQILLFVTVVLAGYPAAPAASAQSHRTRREAREIAESLMSPYCPGLTLAVCSSPGAVALREELARRLDAGEGGPAIVADFVGRFGSRISGVPERHGVGALAWILPPIGCLGILLLAYRAGRGQVPVADSEFVAGEDEEAIAARLDDELRELD